MKNPTYTDTYTCTPGYYVSMDVQLSSATRWEPEDWGTVEEDDFDTAAEALEAAREWASEAEDRGCSYSVTIGKGVAVERTYDDGRIQQLCTSLEMDEDYLEAVAEYEAEMAA